MERHITSHEAVSSFADVLKRVREDGDAFIVEEGGHGICAITPINGSGKSTLADFAALLRSSPIVDEEYLVAVEGHGIRTSAWRPSRQ
jgi:antitoxin (DNA-binding transcriptional repressor) of toxin-antitoxin stability system